MLSNQGEIRMNIVMLIGRLTRDPELRYTPKTGTAVATFSLAVDRELSKEKKQEMESNGQQTADFINIVVFGKQAESCANYLQKGMKAAVNGRLQTRSYEGKDGVKRYVTEVVATRIEFLEWGDKDNDIPAGFEPVDDDNIPF